MIASTLALLFALSLAAAADVCPNGTISTYRLAMVDAVPATKSCYYSFSLVTGTCNFTTPSIKETRPGYVCFNVTQPDSCSDFNKESLTGYVTMTCGGTATIKDLNPLKSLDAGVKTQVTSELANGNMMLALYCDDKLISVIPGCTSFGMNVSPATALAALATIALAVLFV